MMLPPLQAPPRPAPAQPQTVPVYVTRIQNAMRDDRRTHRGRRTLLQWVTDLGNRRRGLETPVESLDININHAATNVNICINGEEFRWIVSLEMISIARNEPHLVVRTEMRYGTLTMMESQELNGDSVMFKGVFFNILFFVSKIIRPDKCCVRTNNIYLLPENPVMFGTIKADRIHMTGGGNEESQRRIYYRWYNMFDLRDSTVHLSIFLDWTFYNITQHVDMNLGIDFRQVMREIGDIDRNGLDIYRLNGFDDLQF